tara:strand:- start:965 stop:1171 length:207 start_codon:yes stop_codon:yes gene_type:complete
MRHVANRYHFHQADIDIANRYQSQQGIAPGCVVAALGTARLCEVARRYQCQAVALYGFARALWYFVTV